jgi:hypothetical protein
MAPGRCCILNIGAGAGPLKTKARNGDNIAADRNRLASPDRSERRGNSDHISARLEPEPKSIKT